MSHAGVMFVYVFSYHDLPIFNRKVLTFFSQATIIPHIQETNRCQQTKLGIKINGIRIAHKLKSQMGP